MTPLDILLASLAGGVMVFQLALLLQLMVKRDE
jgi:hypothetical protein